MRDAGVVPPQEFSDDLRVFQQFGYRPVRVTVNHSEVASTCETWSTPWSV
jgi:hypothetical protein